MSRRAYVALVKEQMRLCRLTGGADALMSPYDLAREIYVTKMRAWKAAKVFPHLELRSLSLWLRGLC